MALSESLDDHERNSRIEWRLYCNMLVTRRFEEALLHWSTKGRLRRKPFRARGRKRLPSVAAWRWREETR